MCPCQPGPFLAVVPRRRGRVRRRFRQLPHVPGVGPVVCGGVPGLLRLHPPPSGRELAPAITSGSDPFLGFHHRWVESFTRKGRYFCARWPSDRAVARAKGRIRAQTARRLLLLPVEDVVSHLNLFLAGWRGYFRHGNSTTVFHDLDRFAEERLARFISGKHGRHGRGYGLRVLIGHDYLGLIRSPR